MFKLRTTSRYSILREAHFYPRKVAAVAAGLLLVGLLLYRLGWPGGRLFLLSTLLVLLVGTSWWAYDRLLRRLSTAEIRDRKDERIRRANGSATWVDILEVASSSAMRRKAAVVRPSLRRLTARQMAKLPTTSYATYLGSVGLGLRFYGGSIGVWASVEDCTLRIGGTRSGKTQSIAGTAIDAPGALVVTSTKADLLRWTGPSRARTGKVWVFCPGAVDGYLSTVQWSVLSGCEDHQIAIDRATAMLPPSVSAEREQWDGQARRMLAMLLHAANLSGRRASAVLLWAEFIQGEQQMNEIRRALRTSPEADTLLAELGNYKEMNNDTLSSITATLMMTLQWLSYPAIRPLGDAPMGTTEFLDLEKFIREGRDSLYLIGSANKVTTPVTAAFTAELARIAELVAADAGGLGRIDPTLTMVLDEASNVVPLALDRWTADFGGRGVSIHISAQSISDIQRAWGQRGADIITSNCFLMVFGGCKDTENLARISLLTGERMQRFDEDDIRPTPVFRVNDLVELPESEALVIRKHLPPVQVTAPQVRLRPWVAQRDAIFREALPDSETGRAMNKEALRSVWFTPRVEDAEVFLDDIPNGDRS